MTEQERKDIQKAMAYDLSWIFRQEPEKTYTAEELDKILFTYITGARQ